MFVILISIKIMKLLLIEDDFAIASSLQKGLKSMSYAVDVAPDGKKGISLASVNDYDVVILDYYLPDIDGDMVAKEIKKIKNNLPIIALSKEMDLKIKIDMLSICDDYVTKPFSIEELVARIKVVTRKKGEISNNVLIVNGLEIDTDSHTVKCKCHYKIEDLSHKEFSLLKYLMQNKNKVMSRSLILEKVWDMNADPFTNTVDVHIQRLRKKLGPCGKKNIVTVAGSGYKFVDLDKK